MTAVAEVAGSHGPGVREVYAPGEGGLAGARALSDRTATRLATAGDGPAAVSEAGAA